MAFILLLLTANVVVEFSKGTKLIDLFTTSETFKVLQKQIPAVGLIIREGGAKEMPMRLIKHVQRLGQPLHWTI